jgi:hypothetical protein
MEKVRLIVKVKPNSSRNEVVGFNDEILQLKIAAPPVKGKANRELVAFISKLLGISKSKVQIVKGETSRTKVLAIEDSSREEIFQRLIF